MPITKQDPVKNMDTGEELRFPASHDRVTRGLVKRILKKYRIEHHPGISRKEGMDIIRLHNLPFDPPPPGLLDEPTNVVDLRDEIRKVGHSGKDGYPAHIGKLKKYCKERGVKVELKDKREDLIRKLENGENAS